MKIKSHKSLNSDALLRVTSVYQEAKRSFWKANDIPLQKIGPSKLCALEVTKTDFLLSGVSF